MGIQTFYSSATSAEQAVAEIQSQANGVSAKGMVFFASPSYDPSQLAAGLQEAFPEVPNIGCTTAGEIVSGKMLSGSLVVMLFGDDVLDDFAIEAVENLKQENNVAAAFDHLGNHFSTPVAEMDIQKYVGLVLVDGLSGAEELLMDEIGNLCDMSFIGGSAGDDLKFEKTHVFVNGKALSNAAVLGIMKLKNGFDILKTQSFCSTQTTLTATQVNEAERRVVSFDGKPAVEAYSEALGCSADEAENRFMHNPVGLMVGEEPYIRSPQRFDGQDIVFYCNIKEGMTLEVMESKDIVEDTRKALEAKLDELGPVSGIIDFHCILRTLELREKNQCDAYGELFSSVPTIGFSTYGEEYIGHINQTSTILIFR